jgi:hypothetical protein
LARTVVGEAAPSPLHHHQCREWSVLASRKNVRGGHALSHGETLAPHCSNPRTYILAPPKTVGVQS